MGWWVFFAVNPLQRMTRRQVADAKTVCATCPVMAECLNYALRRDERFGVWGGMTAEERRRAMSLYRDDTELVILDALEGELMKGVIMDA